MSPIQGLWCGVLGAAVYALLQRYGPPIWRWWQTRSSLRRLDRQVKEYIREREREASERA